MTKPYRAIALVSLLLSLRVCVAADSPATEAWHVYVDKQVPYGSEHVVKRSLANGRADRPRALRSVREPCPSSHAGSARC